MTLPNFLIIGAAKAGTTSLHHYLRQHPQVYMPPQKEINFFAFEGQEVEFHGPGDYGLCTTVRDVSTYREYFTGASTDHIAIGESAPLYLYAPQASRNIHRHLPNAKLIAVLRNPVERAYSSYLHMLRDRRENLSFEEGLLAEKRRIAQDWEFVWHYKSLGFYSEQVKRYLALFPREHMRFYLYEELATDPITLFRVICDFLGVDRDFNPNTTVKYNVTGVPRSWLLQRLLGRPSLVKSVVKTFVPKGVWQDLGWLTRQRFLFKPPLNEATRRELLETFRDDILTLQDLIGRDLSAWVEE